MSQPNGPSELVQRASEPRSGDRQGQSPPRSNEMDGWSARPRRLARRAIVTMCNACCDYVQRLPPWDAFACETETRMTGVIYDGGYADYMLATTEASLFRRNYPRSRRYR